MSPVLAAAVLGSALLHASWNALLRAGADRLWSIAVMSAMSGLAALALTFVVPLPAPAAWPYVVGSAVIQTGYCLFLVRAYRDGHLSQVYPIARGSAPLLVALGAAVFAGEQLSPLAMAGLAMVSGGIMALAFGKDRPDLASTAFALACGVCIAGYMVVDGLGARLSGNALSYLAWMSLAQGAPMPLIFTLVRGRPPHIGRDGETAKALAGGLISMLAYGIVVWAMSRGEMARVSGLRETAILFAAVIGVVFLREPLTLRRSACAVLITAGVVCLSA